MSSPGFNLCVAQAGVGICTTLQIEGADDVQLGLVGTGAIDPNDLLNQLIGNYDVPSSMATTISPTSVAQAAVNSVPVVGPFLALSPTVQQSISDNVDSVVDTGLSIQNSITSGITAIIPYLIWIVIAIAVIFLVVEVR